jgi:uncharacterized protein YydD (DUF2326 family)
MKKIKFKHKVKDYFEPKVIRRERTCWTCGKKFPKGTYWFSGRCIDCVPEKIQIIIDDRKKLIKNLKKFRAEILSKKEKIKEHNLIVTL